MLESNFTTHKGISLRPYSLTAFKADSKATYDEGDLFLIKIKTMGETYRLFFDYFQQKAKKKPIIMINKEYGL